jgi:hypothetical protein
MIDLRDPRLRVLECASCGEPVAGVPMGGRVSLACGYCNADDERELVTAKATEATEAPYRGRMRTAGGRPLPYDLTRPPNGLEHLRSVRVRALVRALPKVRAALVDAKRDLVRGEPEDEFRVLWLAATGANAYLLKGDKVRARAVLETALEVLNVPAYRAMVLARLARMAAIDGATALAEKWLGLTPRGTRVVEAESDIAVAEAFIARARNKPREVLDAIGTRHTQSDFVGPARALAIALRVDAHEQLGERAEAYAVWLVGKYPHTVAQSLGLCPETRRAAQVIGSFALLFLAFLVISAMYSIRGVIVHGDLVPFVYTALATIAMFACFAITKRVIFRRRSPSAA